MSQRYLPALPDDEPEHSDDLPSLVASMRVARNRRNYQRMAVELGWTDEARAEAEHRRQLELNDQVYADKQAERDKEIRLKELERDIEAIRQKTERFRARRESAEKNKARKQELHKRRLDSVDNMVRATILAHAELRDNPLGEELAGEIKAAYDALQKLFPGIELDEETIHDMAERAMLRNFAKQRGVKVE
ncbi:MAG: hypothetical protein M3Q03_17555 [Chloroflexota bacterium]|nr:hypothetical protein [Chloroflexota bacterium]